jgi:hypothetical protein
MADGKNGEEFLFGRVQALGLQLEYDSGFFTVKRSASADQGRDDDGEVEEALLEQLGKHLPDVARIAIGKARGARARDFVGQRCFVPSVQFFGKLTDCSADGHVRVSYRRPSFKDPECDVDLIHSSRGDDLLIIVPDERPAPASKTSFTWIADENLRRLNELFTRAADAGLRLEHDSGFTLVRKFTVQGAERKVTDEIIRELGARLSQVSVRLAARARGERGADFVAKRVFVPELDAFGVLVSCGDDGKVNLTYREKHTKSEQTCWCQGDALLVVPDEKAAAEPTSADQNSETTWQRLMRRAFGG